MIDNIKVNMAEKWEIINSSECPKVKTLGSTLQQAFADLAELVMEFRNVKAELESYKSQFLFHKNKCESKTCDGSVHYAKLSTSKDEVIQCVASMLTTFSETPNSKILQEIFQILCGDILPKTTNGASLRAVKNESPENNSSFKTEANTHTDSTSDVSINEDSLSEIEGTPTGRTSPIIHSKRIRKRNRDVAADVKMKSNLWSKSDSNKKIKLVFDTTPTSGTGKGKTRQARLKVVKSKLTDMVDLTTTQANCHDDSDATRLEMTMHANGTPINVKKEVIDNDDTIMPSPTSRPVDTRYCNISEDFKMPKSPFKLKLQVKPEAVTQDIDVTHMDESINLLNPCRIPKSPKKEMKLSSKENESQPNANISLSILDHVSNTKKSTLNVQKSPKKSPLKENMNVTNTNEVCNSIESKPKILAHVKQESNNRNSPKKEAPLYKQPAPRTKAEKRALPGRSCEECEKFYAALYDDASDKMAAHVHRCSRHRAAAAPATPPGYWPPRWTVPDDTDDFNRMNGVI